MLQISCSPFYLLVQGSRVLRSQHSLNQTDEGKKSQIVLILNSGAALTTPLCLRSARQLLWGIRDGLEGENLPGFCQGKV